MQRTECHMCFGWSLPARSVRIRTHVFVLSNAEHSFENMCQIIQFTAAYISPETTLF